MTSNQQTVEFDQTLHDVNVALDVLTDTLRGVDGCEYPRLLAREIQGLIMACMAHEKVRQVAAQDIFDQPPLRTLQSPPRAADVIKLMGRRLAAREAEISNLRNVLHDGVDTIETHTLVDADDTAVMHGDYQCIKAIEIDRWLDQAEAALSPAPPSIKQDLPPSSELRDELHIVGGGDGNDGQG